MLTLEYDCPVDGIDYDVEVAAAWLGQRIYCNGCGHGKLWSDPCVECEIAGLMDEYKRAARTIARVRDRMRVLGRPMPGMTSKERG